ncbi:YgjV family protein [Pseudomaricurvus alkylphenolicus]|jgi:hypothetical protein|uniref:YgjV family protein n=1 Tax=Pseudomaricurvus alkylphenolicus TaxID=1306991 RepID=UPI0014236544|nr:YgjV family protein [Pseudomaricurvus alkylphenolicus]NIB39868.1 YgjV family protein [Pseudomaricurvus alkylphenolicus]
MSDFVFSQILGLLGLIFDSGSAQFKKRVYFFSAMGIGALFIAGHFYMLEQYTAASMFVIAAVRHFITIRFRSRYLYLVFVLSALGLVALTYSSYLSLLSGLANILMVSGSFSHTQKNMRLLLMVGAFVWLIINVIIFSPAAILLELVFLVSGSIGYYRHVYRPQKQGCAA